MTNYNVFYHFPCNDGELAKVIWEMKYPKSKFYCWDHKDINKSIKILDTLPDHIPIVFLDVCPSITLLSDKHSYIIIDHHENAITTMKKNIELLDKKYNIIMFCDIKKSGCMLAWKYCHNTEMPNIVKYIGSKDIWDFSDINTEPYSISYSDYLTYLDTFNPQSRLATIKILLTQPNYHLHKVFIENGNNTIEEYRKEAVSYFNSISLSCVLINDINYNIIDIKCSNSSIYKYLIEYASNNYNSDVLRILHTSDINKTYSLRSLRDNIMVDDIARFYGGNGHPKAAGYSEKL